MTKKYFNQQSSGELTPEQVKAKFPNQYTRTFGDNEDFISISGSVDGSPVQKGGQVYFDAYQRQSNGNYIQIGHREGKLAGANGNANLTIEIYPDKDTIKTLNATYENGQLANFGWTDTNSPIKNLKNQLQMSGRWDGKENTLGLALGKLYKEAQQSEFYAAGAKAGTNGFNLDGKDSIRTRQALEKMAEDGKIPSALVSALEENNSRTLNQIVDDSLQAASQKLGLDKMSFGVGSKR